MTPLENLTDRLAGIFFSLIGFRSGAVDDDSALLPLLQKALADTPYAGLPIGARLPGRHWEHAVRFLGARYVIKYVSPMPEPVARAWIETLALQRQLLSQYLNKFLVTWEVILVPVSEGLATYCLVMEKVPGHSLLELTDQELFGNPVLKQNLAEFLLANRKLRADRGVFADLVGGTSWRIFDPRYTGNVLVAEADRPVIVDTVLIPAHYEPGKTPGQYRWGAVYHWCYRRFVMPLENRFLARLQKRAG